jgi:hypothetical protein
VTVTLNRIAYGTGATPDTPLATVSGLGVPFDTTGPVDTTRAAVDLNQFRYFLKATAGPVISQPVSIGILQLTYHVS